MKEVTIISPTGEDVRGMDDFGSGEYTAPRGKEMHKGVDFICTPGQPIISPFTGIIQRIAYPYDKSEYQGILLESGWITLKMFYFKPDPKLIGKKVKQGQKIGIAQDISKRYNTPTKKMIPHIHLQVERIDPLVLML